MIDLRSLGKDWRSRASELNDAAAKCGGSVVAICSHRHEISELAEAGIRVHVEKPIRRAKIIAALLETLNRGSSQHRLHDTVHRPSLPAPPPRELQSNGMKILVAEDNAINLKVVHAHLQALGYEVDAVNDGVAALEALKEGHRYAPQSSWMDRCRAWTAMRPPESRERASPSPVSDAFQSSHSPRTR